MGFWIETVRTPSHTRTHTLSPSTNPPVSTPHSFPCLLLTTTLLFPSLSIRYKTVGLGFFKSGLAVLELFEVNCSEESTTPSHLHHHHHHQHWHHVFSSRQGRVKTRDLILKEPLPHLPRLCHLPPYVSLFQNQPTQRIYEEEGWTCRGLGGMGF